MKKRKWLYILIIGLTVLLIIAAIAFKSLNTKVEKTANTIHTKIDREKSDLRNKQVSIKNNDPVSIALFGVDSNTKRLATGDAGRSDSIILISINPKKNSSVMVSIPRDTYSEIVGHDTHEKINRAYNYGGAKMAVESVEKLMNVPIDYYATINMDGIREMIDAVGGVDVISNATFSYEGNDFVQGEMTHLNGKEALSFIRSRKQEGAGGDFGRQERQQLVIQALADRLISISSVSRIDDILKTIEGNVVTDVTFDDLKILRSDYSESLNSVEKFQLSGSGQFLEDNLWYFVPNAEEKLHVQNEYLKNLNLQELTLEEDRYEQPTIEQQYIDPYNGNNENYETNY
ncbi:LytR family transcriptional regulator [Macrococcoides canis]|uniref:LytR family transcriptional regulator n=1 Tax=Macrococcoides canis TaxID=1855823 RepID=A0AAE6X0Y5_9STAP|nr:LCP family protein [Macrococcus canis]QIH77963.1 LytR family transcriptional regulator [Macrococcus canis]